MVPDPQQRHQSTNDFFVGLCLFIPFVVCASLTPRELLVKFFPDDAFYYLQTAANFADSGRATFDGINETNGFHPLYFLIVSGLAWIVGKSLLLHATFLLHGLLVCLSIVLIVHTRQHLASWIRVLLVVLLCLPPFFFFVWFSAGMEASLVLLTTVLFFLAWEQAEQAEFSQSHSNLLLGLSMAGVFLSRLDLIIGLAPFVLYLLLRLLTQLRRERSGLPVLRLMTLLAIPLCIGAAYLLFNYLTTEHFLPISAAVKRTFFLPFELSWQASTRQGDVILSGLALLPLVIALASFPIVPLLARKKRQAVSSGVILLNIAVLAYFAYLRFFASNFFYWYFAFPLVVSAITLIHIVEVGCGHLRYFSSFSSEQKLKGFALGAGMSLNLAFLFFISHGYHAVSYHMQQIARQIDEHTPPGAVVGVFDAGAIGFFSERRIVNLDGLANSYDYLLNFRIPNRFADYFKQENMTHFLVREAGLTNLSEVQSGQYERTSFAADTAIILDSTSELFRYHIPGNFTVLCYRLH